MRPARSPRAGGGGRGRAGAGWAFLIGSLVLAAAGCADRGTGADAGADEAGRPGSGSPTAGARRDAREPPAGNSAARRRAVTADSSGTVAADSAGTGGATSAPGSVARAAGHPEPGSPFPNFPSVEGLPDAPPPWRSATLRLVNGAEGPLVVRARSGAEAVLVDTLAAGDSVDVELRLRADSVTLLAERPGAGEATTRRLVPLPDTLVRIPLP